VSGKEDNGSKESEEPNYDEDKELEENQGAGQENSKKKQHIKFFDGILKYIINICNYDSNNKRRNKISMLAIQEYSPRNKSKIGKVVSQNS
jgi:hypothetical protein